MKRLLQYALTAALAVLLFCFVVQPAEVQAATVKSGTCGTNLTWTLDDTGTLTISGTGYMRNYDDDDPPWYDYTDSVFRYEKLADRESGRRPRDPLA